MRVAVIVGTTIAALAYARVAAADALADAVAHHRDADIADLSAQLAASVEAVDANATGRAGVGDPTVRCALGAALFARGELSRASLYLGDCDVSALPAALEPAIAHALHDLAPKLRDSQLAALAVDTRPAGMIAEIDALPGDRFVAPATIWLPAGTYVVTASPRADRKDALANTVTVAAHTHALVYLDAGADKLGPPKTGSVDFGEEAAGEAQAGPPPDIKHGSLLPAKYRQRTDAPGTLVDPLADRHAFDDSHILPALVRRPRDYASVRAGVALFDDGGAGARVGFSLAAVGIVRTPWLRDWDGLLVLARVEWTRRAGGTMSDALDAYALSIGPALTLVRGSGGSLRADLAMRAEVRGSATLAGTAIERFGVGLDPGVDFAFRGAPIVAGVHARVPLTELAPGVHDVGAIVELGVEF